MIDDYKHLDEDTSMNITVSMERIASECVRLNYGTHRLLSALVHALRTKRAIQHTQRQHLGYPEIDNEIVSPLADGIEKLLNEGKYY